MKSVEDSTVGSARLFALHLPHRLADESGMALWDTTHRHGPNKFPSTTTDSTTILPPVPEHTQLPTK
jgi:hypothetical protein